MITKNIPIQDLTAVDIMNADVICLTEKLPLREAARLLIAHQIGGAPVVDARGRCVGVFTATDFLHLCQMGLDPMRPRSPLLPVTCSFQEKCKTAEGHDAVRCTLPSGVCPIQVKQMGPGGEMLITCSQPNCVLADWQVVNLESLPTDEVSRFMTFDPVTVSADTPISVLARMMIDAHPHRIIVVDDENSPIGMVTSTDILAALAYLATESPASECAHFDL